MGQILVSRLILAPASIEFQAQDSELLNGWLPPLIANRVAVTPGFELGDLRLQEINLAARTGLPPIKRSSIEEKWPSNLVSLQIDGCRCQKLAYDPIEAEHTLHL